VSDGGYWPRELKPSSRPVNASSQPANTAFTPDTHHTMKSTLLVFALLAAGLAPAFAQPTTIAKWTFEASIPAAAGSFTPEVGLGSAKGYHASTSTYSSPAGNGSAHSFSSTAWSVGDYYQFNVSTSTLTGIAVSWDQVSSGTGPRDFKLSYSTNGTTFTDVKTYSVLLNGAPNTAWSSTGSPNPAFNYSYDFSSLTTALDNQASVYFRLIDTSTVSTNAGTVASGGTDRVDNFTVTAIPEPSTYAVIIGALALGLTIWQRRGQS